MVVPLLRPIRQRPKKKDGAVVVTVGIVAAKKPLKVEKKQMIEFVTANAEETAAAMTMTGDAILDKLFRPGQIKIATNPLTTAGFFLLKSAFFGNL